MAMRNFFQLAKKSEYRNNYLPFDYFDFWITAKENENLRCRNKIRDYVHTPFDWDENQEIYLEPAVSENITQATQTSERPKFVPNNENNNFNPQSNSESKQKEKKKSRRKNLKEDEKTILKPTIDLNDKPRRAKSSSPSSRSSSSSNLNKRPQSSQPAKNKFESRSLSSMAIQTPPEWNLRNYENYKKKLNRNFKT